MYCLMCALRGILSIFPCPCLEHDVPISLTTAEEIVTSDVQRCLREKVFTQLEKTVTRIQEEAAEDRKDPKERPNCVICNRPKKPQEMHCLVCGQCFYEALVKPKIRNENNSGRPITAPSEEKLILTNRRLADYLKGI